MNWKDEDEAGEGRSCQSLNLDERAMDVSCGSRSGIATKPYK